MATLRGFRDYDEKDVLNLFAWSGSVPVNKGTLVKIQGDGFVPGAEIQEFLGNMGDFNPGGIVAQRYGVVPKVSAAGVSDIPLGILLFDVREVDENGELLKYRPRKAAEMEAVPSGLTVPIVTRGLFQYSGHIGTAVAGGKIYPGAGGVLSANPTYTAPTISGFSGVWTSGTNAVIGKFLSTTGADGSVVVLLNCNV